MTQTLHLETQRLSEELCALLRQVDPAVFVFRDEPELRARVDRVAERLRALVAAVEAEAPGGALDRIRDRLRGVLAALERATPERPKAPKRAWAAFQREVQPAYESLLHSLRGFVAAPPPSVRPTNYVRSAWHLGSGLAVLGLVQLVPTRAWLVGLSGAFVAWAWSMEVLRRRSDWLNDRLMGAFGRVAHPHERYRVNSSTWYVTALFLLAIFGSRLSQSLAIVVLAVADPAAALIGRRFGRTRLRDGRSLEGTLGFFAAGVLAALPVIAALSPTALAPALALAAVVAAAGAATELFSTRLDDNFTIPVVVAAAAAVMGAG